PAPPASPTPLPAPPPVSAAAVAAIVTVGLLPLDVAATPSAIYVINGDNTVSRIDPSTNSLLSDIQIGAAGDGVPTSITVGDEGDLWISISVTDDAGNFVPGRVVRVDPASGRVMTTLPTGWTRTDTSP